MSVTAMMELSAAGHLGIVPLPCGVHLASSVLYYGTSAGVKFVVKIGSWDIERECKLLRSFTVHPNIIRPTAELGIRFFTMPYYTHTLADIKCTASERTIILSAVVDGIMFIAKSGFVHGDLKLPNILINWPTLHPVIADFGFCHVAQSVPNHLLAKLTTWTIKYGTGIQAAYNASYYITDALMFIKNVFLPMCGWAFIARPRDDIHIAIADHVMDINARNHIYANAISDLTIISMIRRRGTMFTLDPLRIPPEFHLQQVMTTRLKPDDAHAALEYIQPLIAALLEFTRYDSSGAAIPCWIKIRNCL